MAPELAVDDLASMSEVHEKYQVEKSKRLREDKLGQYLDPSLSETFKRLAADPWHADDEAEFGPHRSPEVVDGSHVKLLIIGGGFGGLTFASRFVEQGVLAPQDILFVDSAGGFGGTWYWNRYPGLMCDIESASYMPLLEETGYVPKNKYAYGPELLRYAELLASKFSLSTRGLFRATVQKTAWDDDAHEWVTTIIREAEPSAVAIRSDLVLLATGILNRPKLPKLAGLGDFQNPIFHTARWDYRSTGGSPSNPDLDRLQGKRVGIVGTGASAIQAIPHLAKWAKELYVFQRTPVGVDERGQQDLDPEEWHANIAAAKGWQLERRQNLADFSANASPEKNLAQDGWTRAPTYCALVGSPRIATVTVETLPDYIRYLHELDFPRQQQIRARIDNIVKDRETAEALKPWYASWCKRPLFSDLYLSSYNQPNVRLVNTDGKGLDRLTETGVVACGKEYEVDVLIFSTGFNTYTSGSPAKRAEMAITGRGSYSMDQKWEDGVGTLHGLFTRDFPNLMMLGITQSGASPNFLYSSDCMARHAAYILSKATKGTRESCKVVIEPTQEGEEAWTREIVKNAIASMPVAGCTPSYMNSEGEVFSNDLEKTARGLIWGRGMNDFAELIAAWREEGSMKGLDIKVCQNES
ncbi:hypothetical protein ACJ41O_006835 [Fusarium nematophilum]